MKTTVNFTYAALALFAFACLLLREMLDFGVVGLLKQTTVKLHACLCRAAGFGLLPFILLSVQTAYAGSATWNLTPTSGDWNTPGNWTPATVPNSTTDTATFGTSDTTAISIASSIDLASVTFQPGASAYTLTVTNAKTVNLWGSPNIINNSSVEQNFVADDGVIIVHGTETFDATVHFDVMGNKTAQDNSKITFQGSNVNLGTARMDVEGSDGPFPGGEAILGVGSNGGSSTIVLHRGVNNGYPGLLIFNGGGAGSANIIAEGASERGRGGGHIAFSITETAGTSTITLQGPIARGALGGSVEFGLFTNASASTLIADGGSITFHYESKGGTSRIVLTNRGSLDISDLSDLFTTEITIGSLEGDQTGNVFLGAKKLIVGSNNTSTVYSGVIQEGGVHGGTGGSLEKIGTRTLTLAGANQYTGGTTVTEGDFIVANGASSATGTGPVQVDAGRIGGAGRIAGALTVGNSSGSAATLFPAIGTSKQVTLVVNSALNLNGGASYSYGVGTAQSRADKTVANGVTINAGATFAFHSKGNGVVAPGTVFTAIDNTAATPISGTFGNLADGATITAGRNTYAVSYQGGDGNDLTLTVVP